MKCILCYWCHRRAENCPCYWEGRQDQAIIIAMLPVVEALDKYATTFEGEALFAAIHRWTSQIDLMNSWYAFGMALAARLRW